MLYPLVDMFFSTTGGEGFDHCATGCVATSMAQVMKYHEWPAQATQDIPSYAWYNYDMPLLTPVTFDWNNMLLDYSYGYTDDETTAVATLMMYCGYSLNMDYGPESGTFTEAVAYALKAYFDYNNSTQYIHRNYYTYTNWINIIYNELNQGRPVVYGGSSSTGGHSFVCDGYQGEDYFHINWGWSGSCDGYFKLAALDPYMQGIGGSSSKDGYHFNQETIVGIQKPTDTGTVLDIAPNDINLELLGFTLSSNSIALGESTEAIVTVKNNSDYEFDGDFIIYDLNYYYLLNGESFKYRNETDFSEA